MQSITSASFLRRALAYVVDLAAVYLVMVCLLLACLYGYGQLALGGDTDALQEIVQAKSTRTFVFWGHAILYLSYFTLAHWYAGRTLGKALFQLQVLSRDGQQDLSFGRALGRSFGYVVSGQLTLGLGFLLCLFRRDGRGLHDLLSNTYVRRVSLIPADASGTAAPERLAA